MHSFFPLRSFFLLIGFSLLLSSCVTIVPVEFRRIENFKLNFEKLSPQLSLELVVNNPNPYGITVTEISSDIFLNNQAISKVSLPMKKRIIPRGETGVPIVLNFNLSSVLGLIPASVPTLLTRSVDTRISGYIRVRKFIFKRRVPFSLNQKLGF